MTEEEVTLLLAIHSGAVDVAEACICRLAQRPDWQEDVSQNAWWRHHDKKMLNAIGFLRNNCLRLLGAKSFYLMSADLKSRITGVLVEEDRSLLLEMHKKAIAMMNTTAEAFVRQSIPLSDKVVATLDALSDSLFGFCNEYFSAE